MQEKPDDHKPSGHSHEGHAHHDHHHPEHSHTAHDQKKSSQTEHKPSPKRDHSHGHGHSHGHSHSHGHHRHTSTLANLKLAFVLNLGFSLIELAGGMWSGSVAVQSNAIHDLGDALAVALAYGMEVAGAKKSNRRYSYGYRRLSLVSALVTCGFLVSATCIVLARAIPRLMQPEMPRLDGMAVFAVVGIAVNAYGAYRLSKGGTLNERVVSWHLIEDVLGWAIVLVGTAAIALTHAPIIDAVLSLVMSVFILWGVLRNLHRTLRLFLQATPEDIDLPGLRREIETLTDVKDTHDAHLWSLDGESHVLTLHVVVAEHTGMPRIEELKRDIRRLTQARGNIHLTVEVETTGDNCPAIDCVADEVSARVPLSTT